jgi:ComF family protein
MFESLARLGGTAADFVFPRICAGCDGRIIEPARLVCPACERSMEPLRLPLCPLCGAQEASAGKARCGSCPPGTAHFRRARAVTDFTGVAATLVERLKYNGYDFYAGVLAGLMVPVLKAEYGDPLPEMLVPVPLHGTRERERGYNQARLLAAALGGEFGVSVAPKGALRRARPTPSQTSLGKRERAENVRGAFVVRDAAPVRGARILLVDDVYTTGATLNECARTLAEAGAESVDCIAFARTAWES